MALTNLNPGGTRASVNTNAPPSTLDFGPEHGADWPLWTEQGLISAEDLRLSPDLCGQLRAWSSEYGWHMGHDYEWDQDFDHVAFDRTGDALAAAVAMELGSDYSVRRTTGDAYPWWQSQDDPTNPRAAATFASWILEEERESARHAANDSSVAANVALTFPPRRA